jgi:hypothetical protein
MRSGKDLQPKPDHKIALVRAPRARAGHSMLIRRTSCQHGPGSRTPGSARVASGSRAPLPARSGSARITSSAARPVGRSERDPRSRLLSAALSSRLPASAQRRALPLRLRSPTPRHRCRALGECAVRHSVECPLSLSCGRAGPMYPARASRHVIAHKNGAARSKKSGCLGSAGGV